MDLGSLIGMVFSWGIVGVAIIMGGSFGVFVNIPSLLIVIGGAIGATLVRLPLASVGGMVMAGFSLGFKDISTDLKEVLNQIVEAARVNKTKGPLALESFEVDDPYLKKGLMLCADGKDDEQIKESLETDRDQYLQRLSEGEVAMRAIAEAAPAFGMIGTLVGLVQMLSTMDDPSTIGPSMAVALLTTLYGALVSNVVCLPLADKLQAKVAAESDLKTMIMVGIVQMARKQNPDMIAEQLLPYLPEKQRAELMSEM